MKQFEVIDRFTGERIVFAGVDAKHRYSIENWVNVGTYEEPKMVKSATNVPMTKMERGDFLYMLDNNLDETSTASKTLRIKDVSDNNTINNVSEEVNVSMNIIYEMINEFDGTKKSAKSIDQLPDYQKQIFEELQSRNKLETTQYGIIYKIVKPLNEEVSRLQKIAGIDVDLGGYDDIDAPSKTPVKPDDVSSYPKVEKLEFKQGLANQVNPQDYEFHNDQFKFDKFAQGTETAQSEKCDTPADVIRCVDQRVKELKDSLNDYEGLGYSNQSAMKTNAIEFLEKIKSLLDHKDLEGVKLAQIEYGRLANKVTDLLPPKVVNYILTAINPLASETRDNVDASERDRTNIP